MSKFTEMIDGLQFISANDTTLIGNYEKTEGGYVIKNAVEYNGDMESSLKTLFKKANSGNLNPITMEGAGVAITYTDFTASQKMEAQIIAMKSQYVKDSAVANLQNEAIDNA